MGLIRQLALRIVALCSLAAAAQDAVPVQQVEVVASFPHDPEAFTQGLVFADGFLFEGTGRNGQSSLRRVDLASGEILQRSNLGARYFGEGITILGDRIYQLTWQSHIGFVYDKKSFRQEQTFFLPGEGWGITHDGTQLIVSDGTSTLRFLDPQSFKELKRVSVTESGQPLDRLNELEYIDGEVWANVWYTDFIVRIDPDSGTVVGKLDLSGLYRSRQLDAVLNGIAWDAAGKRLFVTGKLWPAIHEIRVLE